MTCLNGARLTLENCQVGLRVKRIQPRFGGWPPNYPVLMANGGSVVNYEALSDAGYHPHRYLIAPNSGESDHGVVEQLNRASGYLAVRWWKVRTFFTYDFVTSSASCKNYQGQNPKQVPGPQLRTSNPDLY